MTHGEMIAVIQAHKNGERIQYRPRHFDEWDDCVIDPGWNFMDFEYRVKPLVVWINVLKDGTTVTWETKEQALSSAGENSYYERVAVKMVEVED